MRRGAPLGSKNADKKEKLRKLGYMSKAYESFCKHVSEGKHVESWYFESKEISICYETFKKYLEQEPEIFPPEKLILAKAKGYSVWEAKVDAAAFIPFKECNPAVIQMIMRNKFKWDRDLGEKQRAPQAFDNQLKVLRNVDGEWQEV